MKARRWEYRTEIVELSDGFEWAVFWYVSAMKQGKRLIRLAGDVAPTLEAAEHAIGAAIIGNVEHRERVIAAIRGGGDAN